MKKYTKGILNYSQQFV